MQSIAESQKRAMITILQILTKPMMNGSGGWLEIIAINKKEKGKKN